MGQLGFQELFVIFLIALLVFGPRKLPELGKSLGKGIREFKRATEDLKQNWEDQMREVETTTKDIYKDIDSDPSMTGPPIYEPEPQKNELPAQATTSAESTVPKEQA